MIQPAATVSFLGSDTSITIVFLDYARFHKDPGSFLLDVPLPCFNFFTDSRTLPRSASHLASASHLRHPHLVLRDLGEQPFPPAPLRFDSVIVVGDPVASEAMSAMDDHGSEPKLVF